MVLEKENIKDGISVLIRFHDIKNISILEKAVFSLCGQDYGSIYPLVLTQGFNKNDLSLLSAVLKKYDCLIDGEINIVNYPAKEVNKDYRSKLLNLGFKSIQTKYVSILDYDDVMYPNGYKLLINNIEKSGSAIAFGRIRVSDVSNIGGDLYSESKRYPFFGATKYDLFIDNFCPIHSFVINRDICTDELYFDEEMHVLEDYHFLLRIVAKFQSDFTAINKDVGEYRMRKSHTVQEADITIGNIKNGESALSMARRKIDDLKRDLSTDITLLQVQKLRNNWSGMGGFLSATQHENQDLRNRIAILEQKKTSIESAISVCIWNAINQGIKEVQFGGIEEVGIFEGKTKLTGWVFDSKNGQAPNLICVVGLEDQLIEVVQNRPFRPDVAEAMNVENDTFGFEVLLPITKKSDYKVVAFCQGEWHVVTNKLLVN